jgi:hypothetical protein
MSERSGSIRIKKLTYDWDKYFAYDVSNEDHKIFYSQNHPNSAVNDKNSFFYGKILWDVFIYAMAIGKYTNNRKEFSRKTGTIPIEYAKEQHLYSMIGLIFSLSDVDLSILRQPKEIRKICEEYANGGVDVLIEFERTRSPDNPISEYEKQFLKFLKNKKPPKNV